MKTPNSHSHPRLNPPITHSYPITPLPPTLTPEEVRFLNGLVYEVQHLINPHPHLQALTDIHANYTQISYLLALHYRQHTSPPAYAQTPVKPPAPIPWPNATILLQREAECQQIHRNLPESTNNTDSQG
jgi:hypothetical protein